MSAVVLGVDFDNTMVAYNNLFHRVALEKRLIPPHLEPSKNAVRDHLRACGREDEWTKIQGLVYGDRILEAEPFPDALEFFGECSRRRWTVFVISHKTRRPFLGGDTDLHAAAYRWLEAKQFLGCGHPLSRKEIHFEPTREKKLERIGSCGCTHFIDDLPEFLSEPSFPSRVERILFDPCGAHPTEQRFARKTSWKQIADAFFT